MFALIAAVVAAIVGLINTGLGTQKQQEAAITAGYLNDGAFEKTKTLEYYKLIEDKNRAGLILVGLMIVGIFVVGAVILLRKKA